MSNRGHDKRNYYIVPPKNPHHQYVRDGITIHEHRSDIPPGRFIRVRAKNRHDARRRVARGEGQTIEEGA